MKSRLPTQWLMAGGLVLLAIVALAFGFGLISLLLSSSGGVLLAIHFIVRMRGLPEAWTAHLDHQRWLADERLREDERRAQRRRLFR